MALTSLRASTTLTVNKASPVLTWSKPGSIVYGTKLSGAQLNASAAQNGSPVAGSFS